MLQKIKFNTRHVEALDIIIQCTALVPSQLSYCDRVPISVYSLSSHCTIRSPKSIPVVYAQLCHYDVIAFVSVLRMCSLVLVSLVYEKWSQ